MITPTTLDIKGMHCSACTKRVSEALRPFADSVSVTLDPPRAVLLGVHSDADMDGLQRAVARVGAYTASAAAPLTTPSTINPPSVQLLPPQPQPQQADKVEASWLNTYWPLLVIMGYIAVVSLAGTSNGTSAIGESPFGTWMTNVMAGFFLVFSAFKFLDLAGFANAYASYDLLAKRWPAYGYIYPFLELALGLSFLFRLAPDLTNGATLVLMGFSSLGVINALRNRQKIQCACLGTVLKLPMSTVTLVEDVTMAAMAAVMLLS